MIFIIIGMLIGLVYKYAYKVYDSLGSYISFHYSKTKLNNKPFKLIDFFC